MDRELEIHLSGTSTSGFDQCGGSLRTVTQLRLDLYAYRTTFKRAKQAGLFEIYKENIPYSEESLTAFLYKIASLSPSQTITVEYDGWLGDHYTSSDSSYECI